MENKDILRVMDYEKMKQRTQQAIYDKSETIKLVYDEHIKISNIGSHMNHLQYITIMYCCCVCTFAQMRLLYLAFNQSSMFCLTFRWLPNYTTEI